MVRVGEEGRVISVALGGWGGEVNASCLEVGRVVLGGERWSGGVGLRCRKRCGGRVMAYDRGGRALR